MRSVHTHYASQSAALLDQIYKFILFLTTLYYRYLSTFSQSLILQYTSIDGTNVVTVYLQQTIELIRTAS